MGGRRKRRRVVSDEEWEKDRDDHVPARLAVLSAKGTREVEDKLVLSRLRRFTNTAQDVSKGSNLDSEETKTQTGSPRPESHRLADVAKFFLGRLSNEDQKKLREVVAAAEEAQRPLRVGTLCSGTDAPVPVLKHHQRVLGEKLVIQHLFSCEFDKEKQAWI